MSEIYSSPHDQSAAQPMSVGKRSLIHRLARCGGKFLFTRPPGFGKTHLIKSLARHFSHPISGSSAEAPAYLVACPDFETCRYITSVENFRTQFRQHLTHVFAPYGFAFEPTQRFGFYSQLSRWLQRVPTASLVLLIDNYDAPLRSCLNNPTSFQAVSQELASFFSEVQFHDRAFQFVFLTGITKLFSETHFPEELDDVIDLSLDPEYAALAGFSAEELMTIFRPALQAAASRLGVTTTALLSDLNRHYGRYCFDENVSVHRMNPNSVLRFLKQPQLGFRHGEIVSHEDRQTLCIRIKQTIRSTDEAAIPAYLLGSFAEPSQISDTVLLTRFGFLSIFKKNEGLLRVRYPNLEVEAALFSLSTPPP